MPNSHIRLKQPTTLNTRTICQPFAALAVLMASFTASHGVEFAKNPLFEEPKQPAYGKEVVEFRASDLGGWRFSAGVIFRDIGDVSFDTGSRASFSSLPRPFRDSFRLPGGVGGSSGSGFRQYANGFVGPDRRGTTPGSAFAGTTSRFGFQSTSQNNNDMSPELCGSGQRVGNDHLQFLSLVPGFVGGRKRLRSRAVSRT